MRVLCLGLNHKTTNVELREKLAFSPQAQLRALEDLKTRWPDAQFLLLSTCNRTELYTARPLHSTPREEDLRQWLGEFHDVDITLYRNSLYCPTDMQAVSQLFRVVAGLDSLVPGETQIVAQVKQAQQTAQQAGVIGSHLVAIISEAFRAAKHIRTETAIADGKVSVASVALDCIGHVFTNLKGKRVLSIGAGKMNQLILQQLNQFDPLEILITNRTHAKAIKLADCCAGKAVDFSTLSAQLARADVILTSTGSTDPIISSDMIRTAQHARRNKPLLMIDLAVPRDIAPAAGDIENVYLYNVDDLENVVASSIQARKASIDDAERILAEHLDEYTRQISTREVQPTLEALYRRIEDIIQAETEEARNKFSTHEDAEEDMEILSRALRRAMRKFCHPAAENLKDQAQKGTGSTQADILWNLLNLTPPEDLE